MGTDPKTALVQLGDTDLMLANEEDDVRGRTVVDRSGDDIGKVDDLIIDPDERRVRFLQVGAGGVLGIGEQQLLVPVDAIARIDDDAIHIQKEREYVASAPLYHPRLVEEPNYYEDLYGYWGYPPYWSAGYAYPRYPYYP